MRSAEVFGSALSEAGQTLPPDFVCNALALMPDRPGGRMPMPEAGSRSATDGRAASAAGGLGGQAAGAAHSGE